MLGQGQGHGKVIQQPHFDALQGTYKRTARTATVYIFIYSVFKI